MGQKKTGFGHSEAGFCIKTRSFINQWDPEDWIDVQGDRIRGD